MAAKRLSKRGHIPSSWTRIRQKDASCLKKKRCIFREMHLGWFGPRLFPHCWHFTVLFILLILSWRWHHPIVALFHFWRWWHTVTQCPAAMMAFLRICLVFECVVFCPRRRVRWRGQAVLVSEGSISQSVFGSIPPGNTLQSWGVAGPAPSPSSESSEVFSSGYRLFTATYRSLNSAKCGPFVEPGHYYYFFLNHSSVFDTACPCWIWARGGR